MSILRWLLQRRRGDNRWICNDRLGHKTESCVNYLIIVVKPYASINSNEYAQNNMNRRILLFQFSHPRSISVNTFMNYAHSHYQLLTIFISTWPPRRHPSIVCGRGGTSYLHAYLLFFDLLVGFTLYPVVRFIEEWNAGGLKFIRWLGRQCIQLCAYTTDKRILGEHNHSSKRPWEEVYSCSCKFSINAINVHCLLLYAFSAHRIWYMVNTLCYKWT